eukprot:4103849-Amphidinium_carterae.1
MAATQDECRARFGHGSTQQAKSKPPTISLGSGLKLRLYSSHEVIGFGSDRKKYITPNNPPRDITQ